MLLARSSLADATPGWIPPLDGNYFTGNYPERSAAAVVDGRLYLTPLAVPQAVSVDRLAVNHTTAAASSTMRLAIYRDDPAIPGYPGRLLAEAATIDTSAAPSFAEAALNGVFALQPGRYWLAAVGQGGTPAVTMMTQAVPWLTSPAATAATGYLVFSVDSITGALPTANPLAGGSTQRTFGPIVFARSAP